MRIDPVRIFWSPDAESSSAVADPPASESAPEKEALRPASDTFSAKDLDRPEIEEYLKAPYEDGRTKVPEKKEEPEAAEDKSATREEPESKVEKEEIKSDAWFNPDLEKAAQSWGLPREDALEFGSEKLLVKHLKHLKAVEDHYYQNNPAAKAADAGQSSAQDKKADTEFKLPEGLNWEEFDDGTKDVARVILKDADSKFSALREEFGKQVQELSQQFGNYREQAHQAAFITAFEAALPSDDAAAELLGKGSLLKITDEAIRANRMKIFDEVKGDLSLDGLDKRVEKAFKAVFFDELAKRAAEKHHKKLYDHSRRRQGGTGTPKVDSNLADVPAHEQPEVIEAFNALRNR